KATWSFMDDGVFWARGPQGVEATLVDSQGPGARAGIRVGDVLLGIDGDEVKEPRQVDETLRRTRPHETRVYSLLRASEQRSLEIGVERAPRGHASLFYYRSLVGFFCLVVGTIVMLRRPLEGTALHFYAICLLFFLVYSTSYTGRLDLGDWVLFWTDHLAVLFLPVVFLHFCLSFPEPRFPAWRQRIVLGTYTAAIALGALVVVSQVFFLRAPAGEALWRVSETVDRWQPFYFAVLFAASFGILWSAYRRTRSLLARRQMKWLVWGTGAAVVPFFLFYALPFALLGREPRLATELAGYIPLALIPLSLAYAVVEHRLMDVELIFRRGLVYTLATAAIVGISLLANEIVNSLAGQEEPHTSIIVFLSTLVVLLLFTPVKDRIQEGIERLFYRERYNPRRALLRLSQDLNADLDLGRMTERLIEGVCSALGVSAMAAFLPEADGFFSVFRSIGCTESARWLRLAPSGQLLERLAEGNPVNLETSKESWPEVASLDLVCYFPCRVKGEVIAVLGLGQTEDHDPLNSEEVELLQALASQAATSFMNGRHLRSLREKAEELQRLTEYNENILESMDSGILVLDLEGLLVRWNRAMEALFGTKREEVLGKKLDDIFPASFVEAFRGSLVLGRQGEIDHIYKIHLPTPDGRSLMVNVAVAPFHVGSGARLGSILILDDVTARVRLEEHLQHSEKMASIGLLAAGVAHEVNTPLTGISSYTQMLRGQVDVLDPRAGLLEKIEKQTFRAAKIINNLLNFSRSARPELEPLDVNKVLLEVLSLLEHQLEAGRIKVRKDLTEVPRVRGNESRIQQVFFNLILNARDAMPRGGWLTLKTFADDDTVVLEVSDTGHGIKREDIKRIYDPFFTTKGIGRGTGLGLSVSYGILQEHGGAIFVDSVQGKGTTFQVALPALELSEAAER
ncbi:MAG TPA: ATP-binding protein, partial [Vicinamibacteria bacterium]|nr:ATP-binding protein [Vicinamibacteria bacterium]